MHVDDNLNGSNFTHLVGKSYIVTVENTIQVAKKLEISILNKHINHGLHFTLPERKVKLFEQYKETYLESIMGLRDMCEQIIGHDDIHICIENTNGFTDYEKEAIELLLQSNVFALTWDIGHSNSCDNKDEAFIMKHEKQLQHFHIHDGSNKSDHMTLGTGDIDLIKRLDIAKQNNCRCVVETKTVDALRKSIQWLKANYYLEG